jgi:hypothetical protein
MTAFIIGNGVSRKSIDLSTLNGTIIGCNALYREFTPDILVAVDKRMVIEIRKSGYQLHHEVWCTWYEEYDTRNFKGFNYIRDGKYWSSGPTAQHLACTLGHKEVVLLGFDLVGVNGLINNMYANTFNYKQATDPERGHTNTWLPQHVKCAKDFPDVKFVRVVGDDAYIPEEFIGLYEHITTKNFLDKYNVSLYTDAIE